MANAEQVDATLQKAIEKGGMQTAIVVGRGENGKIEFYFDRVDREKLIVDMTRAIDMLVRSMQNG